MGSIVGGSDFAQSVVKARFDGTFPLACPSRDLCDIQILAETEHDHDPVIRAQVGHGLPKSVILAT
jgi:hypothetical protein